MIGKGGVLSIIFSTDGQLLASGHEYGLTFLWDTTTGKEITRFERPDLPDKQGEIDYATWRLAWHPSGSFLAASYNDGTFRLLDTRPYLPPQSANVTQTEPLPEYRYLPKASTVLPGKPLVLLHDLTQLTGNYRPDNTVAALKNHPIIRDLIALRWPQAARVGLAGLILHQVPFPDWVPPEGLTPTMLRDGLSVALAGEEIEPEQVTVPLAALRKAADSIDDRMLALLQLLGPEAVAKDPGLPIRLLPHVDHLPPLTAADRRLLGLRLDLRGAGRASGRGPGAERAGVSARGAPRDLLPGQLALAHDLFAYRAYTNTLLYRDRQGREPPLLRPTVLLLDVSPPVFGPVEGTTRLAAHAVAATLVEAGIPCVLVTAGGRPTVRHLKQAADLMEIWTARVYDFPDEAEALKRAEALAGQLRDGPLEPVILLLTHAHFACDLVNPPKPAQLRGLFIQYPNQEKRPALADHCRRWESLPAGNKPTNLAGILAHLVG
ncbi:MAG: hypothetical protein QNK37_33880 [Acidobacteriota bacterium]|nr:hypothetical protein [Acidobacteriota bacterium]